MASKGFLAHILALTPLVLAFLFFVKLLLSLVLVLILLFFVFYLYFFLFVLILLFFCFCFFFSGIPLRWKNEHRCSYGKLGTIIAKSIYHKNKNLMCKDLFLLFKVGNEEKNFINIMFCTFLIEISFYFNEKLPYHLLIK